MLSRKKGILEEIKFQWRESSLLSQSKKDDDYSTTLEKAKPGEFLQDGFRWEYEIERLSYKLGVHPLIPTLIIFSVLGILVGMALAPAVFMFRNVRHMDMLNALSFEEREAVYRTTNDLVETAHSSNLKAFEDLLLGSLEPHCLRQMPSKLHGDSLEQFHFNLAKVIKHASRNGSFEHYCDMKIAPDGRILDTHAPELAGADLSKLQSCALLEAVFDVGIKRSNGIPPNSGDDYFGGLHNWRELDDGILFLTRMISPRGQCAHLGKELSKEAQKELVVNSLTNYASIAQDPSLEHKWTHYVIERNGKLKMVESVKKDDSNVLWCLPLENSFNAPHVWRNPWFAELATETLRKFMDDEKLEEIDRKL